MPTVVLRPNQLAARDALIAQRGGPLQDIAGQNAARVIIEATGAIARDATTPLVIVAAPEQEHLAGALGIHEWPDTLRITSPRDASTNPAALHGAAIAVITDLPESASGVGTLLRIALDEAAAVVYLAGPNSTRLLAARTARDAQDVVPLLLASSAAA